MHFSRASGWRRYDSLYQYSWGFVPRACCCGREPLMGGAKRAKKRALAALAQGRLEDAVRAEAAAAAPPGPRLHAAAAAAARPPARDRVRSHFFFLAEGPSGWLTRAPHMPRGCGHARAGARLQRRRSQRAR